MRVWACSIFLIFACADDTLQKTCPTECIGLENEYTKEEIAAFSKQTKTPKSACKFGTPTCNDNKDVVVCDGVVFASRELCNGINDDCDNFIDESISNYQSQFFSEAQWEAANPCVSAVGECRGALAKCDGENGWWCDYEFDWLHVEVDADGLPVENETVCDGYDGDCDGRVDEGVFAGEFCFGPGVIPDEDWWKATQGQCRAGARMCVDGAKECVGDVLPSIELCDMKDNDCDGVIDNTIDVLMLKYDIVFIIDTSGSMCSYISAVAAALDAYIEQFEMNSSFRFALVITTNIFDVNGDGISNIKDLVYRLVDFTDIVTLRDKLLTLGCSGSGLEESLGGMAQVCDIINNPLNLSWRGDSYKLFFGFSDELCQTFTDPPTTESDVVFECTLNGVLPFMWSTNWGRMCYDNIANDTNGLFFEIDRDWEKIFDDLNSIIITLCGALE